MAGTDPFPRAGALDDLAVTAVVLAPNLVQGLFRRLRLPVLLATLADVDGAAVRVLAALSRRHDGRPVRLRAGLLMLDPADTARVLGGTVEDYAADTGAKRRGMVHFQPTALTISRGRLWRDRRTFTETVLGRVPRLAARFTECAEQEAKDVVARGPALSWRPWNRAMQRIARRIVLGDAAADDQRLSDTLARMMTRADTLPGKPSKELAAFHEQLGEYVRAAGRDSLAGWFADTPSTAWTDPTGQLAHWLFALGDTLAINTLRTIAVVAQRPRHLTRALTDDRHRTACLLETMRLWPTTAFLSRETRRDVAWHGGRIPAGTQVLVVNTYQHRDPDRLDFPDTFVPEQWLGTGSLPFHHFGGGPQICPGIGLAELVGAAVLRVALEHTLAVRAPHLPEDEPVPHMLDFFGIRVAVA